MKSARGMAAESGRGSAARAGAVRDGDELDPLLERVLQRVERGGARIELGELLHQLTAKDGQDLDGDGVDALCARLEALGLLERVHCYRLTGAGRERVDGAPEMQSSWQPVERPQREQAATASRARHRTPWPTRRVLPRRVLA